MSQNRPSIAPITVIGLVLVLGPVLTMAHELGGHAVACMATGSELTELGAYYVQCTEASLWDSRLVAMAGTSVDIIIAVIAFFAWHVLRHPLARLVAWMVAVIKGLVAAGYWLFSGVVGVGDWAPGPDAGMGVMAHPWLWRLCLVVVGLACYIAMVRWAMRSIDAMLGGGETAQAVRKRTVMLLYFVNGAVAVVVGLFNPVGFWIILMSAVASSFGGLAGLFNVAFHKPVDRPPEDFVVARSYPLLALGVVVTLAYAAILGPTLTLVSG